MKGPAWMYTSRYAAAHVILPSGLAPVRITRGGYRRRLDYRLAGTVRQLAPGDPVWEARDDPGRYAELYGQQLDALGTDEARQLLQEVRGKTPGVVLLCFEDLSKPGAWCHRRLFAEWWTKNTGEDVPELGSDPAVLK